MDRQQMLKAALMLRNGLREHSWVNAWRVANAFEKRPVAFLRLDSTQQYIERLSKHLGRPKKAFFRVHLKGSHNEQATMFAPELLLRFARWIDPRLEEWLQDQTSTLLEELDRVDA